MTSSLTSWWHHFLLKYCYIWNLLQCKGVAICYNHTNFGENSLTNKEIIPTIVGILTFMSRKNFMLSWVEHEKSFITSGPDLSLLGTYATLVFFSLCGSNQPIHLCHLNNLPFFVNLRILGNEYQQTWRLISLIWCIGWFWVFYYMHIAEQLMHIITAKCYFIEYYIV